MRGVAIPELREQLFAATERILARDGAAGVTSRAITDEAGWVVGCWSALQQCGDDLVDLPGIERCAVLGEEQVVHGADE